jgi:putative holliday junction resolvase
MILGIDWGAKKVGLAISHKEVSIAQGIGVVANNSEVFDELSDIIDKYEVDLIVIGRSSHETQKDNTQEIDDFAQKCREILGVNVEFTSEAFSTQEAQKNLIMAGRKKIAQNDDRESARIILQGYLDAKNQ